MLRCVYFAHAGGKSAHLELGYTMARQNQDTFYSISSGAGRHYVSIATKYFLTGELLAKLKNSNEKICSWIYVTPDGKNSFD